VVATALRGALGFLTRLPVDHGERAWEAFRTTPASFPLAGHLVGAVLAVPLLLPVPAAIAAALYLGALVGLTGITHLDGLADLGDGLAVHGDAERRRAVMHDSAVGVGALVAVALVVLALWSGVSELAARAGRAALLVVTAEVAAKLATAAVVCLGTASHEGLGSALTGASGPRDLLAPAVLATPAAALTWPRPASALALFAGAAVGPVVVRWAERSLGGVSGDVMGATNELARAVALLVGVVAWSP
jgi:adenosylcobinamide-GDP ribazoletransferase